MLAFFWYNDIVILPQNSFSYLSHSNSKEKLQHDTCKSKIPSVKENLVILGIDVPMKIFLLETANPSIDSLILQNRVIFLNICCGTSAILC